MQRVIQAVKPNTLLSEEKLAAIWGVLDMIAGVPGDLAELGVYRGGTSRLMALHSPHLTMRIFDTFAGIPNLADTIDHHKAGEFAAGESEVRAYLADVPNATFHAGTFPETAAGESFAAVHLDADLYQSTIAGLRWFWPRLSAGGAIILDDWQWEYCKGVERAVQEFLSDKNDATPEEWATNQLIVWKHG